MNITNRTTHDVQQGTGAWLRLREGFATASEAPAALGVSRYVNRAELLRQKHTGLAPEHSPATLGKFAAGHAAEAQARPLAEPLAGDELFPATMSATVDGMPLLASLDGLTLDGETAWETKLWNEELAAAVRQGADALPEHYTVQMDQELLVSGARRCLFTCTDGTPERFVHCWYEPGPERFVALLAGWTQFNRDLAAYVPPQAAEPAPVGKAPETLPALLIQVTGAVTASNLAEFKATALGAIRSVNRDLKTDQHFADAERAVKWCGDVETRLAAAKEHALSQTATIDALFKTIDEISAEARRVRLDLDKLVTRRKTEVKEEAITAARAALDLHISAVNAEIAPMRIQPAAVDWAGAIKGKRSIDSMQDALDTLLASAKIAADTQGRAIQANVVHFHKTAQGMEFLFSDLGQLVHKSPDDFEAVLAGRIRKQMDLVEAQEKQRKADEAARIAEAERRAAAEAEARLRAEQETQARREREAAEADRLRQQKEFTEGQDAQQVLKAEPATADATDRAVPANTSPGGGPMGAGQPAAAGPAGGTVSRLQPAANEPATLTLGMICERLQFTVRADFLADALHVSPAAVQGKRPGTYTETQFRTICRQLQSHISAMAELYTPSRAA